MDTKENKIWWKRGFSCCDSEGAFEILKGCFPDDAGFVECCTMMQGMQGRFCNSKENKTATENEQGCC